MASSASSTCAATRTSTAARARRRWLLLTARRPFRFARPPQGARSVARPAVRDWWPPVRARAATAHREPRLPPARERRGDVRDWRRRWTAAVPPPRRRWAGSRSRRAHGVQAAVLRARPRRACSRTRELPEPAPLSAIRSQRCARCRQRDVARPAGGSTARAGTAEGTVSWAPRASRSATRGAALRRAVHAGGFARPEAAARIQRWARRHKDGDEAGRRCGDGRASGPPARAASSRRSARTRPTWPTRWAASTAA